MPKKFLPKKVLDAWAILALLQGEEPAASVVAELLATAGHNKVKVYISLINLGEVFYSIGKRKGEEAARETLEELYHLPIVVSPAEHDLVLKAATLKIHHPLSYADAFAVALAQSLDAPVVTGDPEICSLPGEFSVEILHRTRQPGIKG